MRGSDKLKLNMARTAELDKLKKALPKEDKITSAVTQAAVYRGSNNRSQHS